MRSQLKKLQDMRKNEDPRLSFSTPEFKEAQRVFTDAFKVGGAERWGLDSVGWLHGAGILVGVPSWLYPQYGGAARCRCASAAVRAVHMSTARAHEHSTGGACIKPAPTHGCLLLHSDVMHPQEHYQTPWLHSVMSAQA
jgi:hypothetical protein